ncbi:unnamed protein product [Pocillopora meandrina]|uniref:Uncharacterized protein n=1 Tax=Pocillopora meandrina TaxID=46732 RepID=A0AAU9VUG3_9CNID|nr:unnamed protein product [Pocillopora meandrina]
MGLILQLLQIVLISTQLLKEATTTTTTNATATAVTASAITSRTEILNTGIATNVAQTSSPSVNDTILTRQMSLSSSALHKPSFSQSRETTQSASTTLNTTTTTRGFSKPKLKAMNTTSSVDAGTTAVSHVLSQPKSVSQSTPSADLNSTQSKASSYITGVPNRTQFINSSYGTSSMIFTNSGSATLLVTPTTTEQTSSPSPRKTTQSASTTLNETTTIQGFSTSSRWQISSDYQTSPLSTPKAMNTTSSVDAGTTAVSHVLSQPKSVSQSTPSADLNSTQSKASSYITGVPNQTLSINSSYGTSLMILTNSGSATTQAVYFTSDHPTKESSSLLVAHTTTDSFTKLTSAISVSVSLNWTGWSVDSRDCQRHCSNMGGTVTASRHCYSHTVTFSKSICTQYNISTKVFKCQQHCPISGTTLLGVSISTVVVGTLLHMLPNFFGG